MFLFNLMHKAIVRKQNKKAHQSNSQIYASKLLASNRMWPYDINDIWLEQLSLSLFFNFSNKADWGLKPWHWYWKLEEIWLCDKDVLPSVLGFELVCLQRAVVQ